VADIAPIKGLIELQDDFTGQLGIAEAALGNFTRNNQESLKAVAGAAGLVVAALGAVTIAVIALGNRGSDVNDVRATLEHFVGTAEKAEATMEALRQGTKNTVDNFTLAKEAAHLLSAGVKLTTEEFGTLGQAAFVLQNRGLGPTKEQLGLISDALVTGRTRALAMSLGVIDNTNAMEDYAKSIGVTVDQLSDAGKAEAKRIEVMRLLKVAVKDAGEQARDFGEQFEAAQAAITNWVDDLGGAIAESKVFSAAFKSVEEALKDAFGDGGQEAIQQIVHAIEQGAIAVLGFASDMLVLAKIADNVWNGIRTVVLAVETVIVGTATAVAELGNTWVRVGYAVGLVSDQTAASMQDTTTALEEITKGLAIQTAEAAKATVATSEFDNNIDKLRSTLDKTQQSMIAASNATMDTGKTNEVQVKGLEKLAATQEQVNQKMVNATKVQQALEKSTKELNENSGLTFSREALKEQLDKYRELQGEVRNYGRSVSDAVMDAASSIQILDKSWVTDADIAEATINKTTVMVRTLSGELITLMEAQRRQQQGFSYQVEPIDQFTIDKTPGGADALLKELLYLSQNIETMRMTIKDQRDQNNYFHALARYNVLRDAYNLLISQSKKKPASFEEGGTVMVGERGPEIVRLPIGATVYPTGMMPIPQDGMAGDVVFYNTWQVNGTGADVARDASRIIMRQLKNARQFGSA